VTGCQHFVATTEETTAEGLVRLFRDNVWKLHGLPESVISDGGPQFVAELTKELNRMLGIYEIINGVPPTKRWANRTDEPRVGAILVVLHRV